MQPVCCSKKSQPQPHCVNGPLIVYAHCVCSLSTWINHGYIWTNGLHNLSVRKGGGINLNFYLRRGCSFLTQSDALYSKDCATKFILRVKTERLAFYLPWGRFSTLHRSSWLHVLSIWLHVLSIWSVATWKIMQVNGETYQ